jgi:cell division septation protein DedD
LYFILKNVFLFKNSNRKNMLNKTETPESGKPNPEHPTPPEKKDAKAKPEPIERRKEKIEEDEAKPKKGIDTMLQLSCY